MVRKEIEIVSPWRIRGATNAMEVSVESSCQAREVVSPLSRRLLGSIGSEDIVCGKGRIATLHRLRFDGGSRVFGCAETLLVSGRSSVASRRRAGSVRGDADSPLRATAAMQGLLAYADRRAVWGEDFWKMRARGRCLYLHGGCIAWRPSGFWDGAILKVA